MKKTIKLIPAIVMLLVSAILVSTSTYAWFSMNNRVTVTGMTVTTKVNNNLLIAPYNSSDDTYLGNQDANYSNALHQTVEAQLEPVSTINGIDFYYTATSNVKADGDAKTDVYVAYNPASTTAFDTNYGTTGALGYVDYVFYLKATNTDSAPRAVYMDKCNLLYKGETTTNKAWRAAMFVQTLNENEKLTTPVASTMVKTILTPASSVNQQANKAVLDASHVDTLAYGHNTSDNDITEYNPAATVDASLASGGTQRYKVTLRFWLEGEDKECKNDVFAPLTGDWRLDLAFSIGTGTGVTSIGSVANAVTTDATTATVTLTADKLSNGETPDTYQWYLVGATDTAATGTGNNTATYTGGESGKTYYCLVTTINGNVYRTNNVTLS